MLTIRWASLSPRIANKLFVAPVGDLGAHDACRRTREPKKPRAFLRRGKRWDVDRVMDVDRRESIPPRRNCGVPKSPGVDRSCFAIDPDVNMRRIDVRRIRL